MVAHLPVALGAAQRAVEDACGLEPHPCSVERSRALLVFLLRNGLQHIHADEYRALVRAVVDETTGGRP